MSQQGEKPDAHEDDWWRALYDETAPDTGPSGAPDSLDARFDSVSDAVGVPEPGAVEGPEEGGHPATLVPLPDPRPPEAAPVPEPPRLPRTVAVGRAPWEAPDGPPRPRTFAVRPPPAPPGPPVAPRPPVPPERPTVGHIGDRPPTYDAEPAALPESGPDALDALVPDTVLDGARYGTYTLRAASVRGDSARFRGEPRRDALLTARFGAGDGALVLVAVAGGVRGAGKGPPAAADACRWIGAAVARSHARLSDDIRAGRRGDLKSGLHRLTDRTYGKLRARAAELGLEPSAYTTGLRCLLLSADPECRTRVFFGIGPGGVLRLRDGAWQDLDPVVPATGGAADEQGADGDRLTMDLQVTTSPSRHAASAPPPAEPFRFRASVARPGDTLLLCGNGLAEPMRGEPELAGELARRWSTGSPPGLPAYLADIQIRTKGYADDRTGAAVWEA
ncbi:protein phosphatase 2C domain-containing protein [Streptomyces sp. JH34]|uniref:protein phosphatase 2C domain-containing protein n=1 Tax=Streptomyces sp. JH34 TaxID=2793633 RepID=UPI0023FA2F2B|nr:protein phosphatase 2C domain-containing protein [Streptomyces sp. JH34]MDF6018010.1 protein phosphatase 2C domain-containing protein [Streptomyces sp. JH34]